MARAKRHYIPGQIWHITQRCHKREFLLKFVKDKQRWIQWLFEAKRRYGLTILNYVVTSNHIHLMVVDDKDRLTIPRAMQLTAGRHAQEYNQRKKRKGAYWEDRYHATAIQTGDHLLRCLVYIDLNIVRAGVVSHPSEWVFGGYNEIQSPRRKCILIDYDKLGKLSGCGSYDSFKVLHRNLVANAIENNKTKHDARWSQSIAVGEIHFVKDIKNRLGSRAVGRKTRFLEDGYELREDALPYAVNFDAENDDIAPENTYKWTTSPTITDY